MTKNHNLTTDEISQVVWDIWETSDLKAREVFSLGDVELAIQRVKAKRLEYLRGEIEAERISYEEIAELQSLADYIDSSDSLLLEWAGVGEHYTVWVGDGEVNSHYVSKHEAEMIAQEWRAKGYDDVVVEKIEEAE